MKKIEVQLNENLINSGILIRFYFFFVYDDGKKKILKSKVSFLFVDFKLKQK